MIDSYPDVDHIETARIYIDMEDYEYELYYDVFLHDHDKYHIIFKEGYFCDENGTIHLHDEPEDPLVQEEIKKLEEKYKDN